MLVVGEGVEVEAHQALSVSLAQAREEVAKERGSVVWVRLRLQKATWRRQFGGAAGSSKFFPLEARGEFNEIGNMKLCRLSF